MRRSDFNDIVHDTLSSVEGLLVHKGAEYANESDVFHNFKSAARKLGVSREKALQGMWIKHLVSVDDMIDEHLHPTHALVHEKINDSIAYLILLKGMLLQRANSIHEVKL